MHAHFVLAHPGPQSFNAHMVREGAALMDRADPLVLTVSDVVAPAASDAERLVRPGARLWRGLYKLHAVRKRPFRGKRAMLSVAVGTSPDTYAHDGRSGDIDLLLWR